MKSWALIPARGGSKSIRLKNLVPVKGIPMIDYGALAAKNSGCFERLVCSTEHDGIAAAAQRLGYEVDWRPEALCGDDTPVTDVVLEWIKRCDDRPEAIALIQPTSPFLRVEHVRDAMQALADNPAAASAQTITPIPHNHHAWNQRELTDGMVNFRFREERSKAYNKQSKPRLYSFGNFVALRTEALLAGESFFAEPSVGVEIQRPYDFDLDTQEDLALAEAMIDSGLIELPHLATT